MGEREELELPIPGHMVDIPVATKLSNSQADDANENNNVITLHVFLFLRQLIHDFSTVVTVFFKKA